MLAYENVGQHFGAREVLSRIDLRFAPGERVALLGPSGSGKTTLFRLAYGGIAPTTGRVVFHGDDLAALHGAALRRLRARIAIVPQAHGLVDQLSAGANVIAGTLGRRTTLGGIRAVFAPTREEREAARAALAHVGLAERIDDRVFSLSGGQRQRVAVARAWLQRADLVLADEPAASLDPELARETVALLLDDAKGRGSTLVCTLHQHDLVAGFDRVVELEAGRVVRDGAPEIAAA